MTQWTDALAGGLLSTHRYADGVSWGYVATGLVENSATSPNAYTQELIAEILGALGTDLRSVSEAEGMPLELLVVSVALLAERVGTASTTDYVEYLPGFVNEEQTPGLAYAGCTGLRFDRVRSLMGPISLASYLASPSTAITAAARHILSSISETKFQPPMVASAYNTDGMRFDSTSRLRLSGPEQIDRFLGWFNATVSALVANNSLAGTAPSFSAALSTMGPTVPLPPSTTNANQKYFRPESQAAIDAGMMTVCERNPTLSTIWSLDDVTTTQITNLALGVGAGQGLPLGQPAFAYPDRNRTMRLMNPDEVQKLYRAMRDYITAIILHDTGHSPSLPGQPVFMS